METRGFLELTRVDGSDKFFVHGAEINGVNINIVGGNGNIANNVIVLQPHRTKLVSIQFLQTVSVSRSDTKPIYVLYS